MVNVVAVCPTCEGALLDGGGGRLSCGACGFEGRVRTDLTEGLSVGRDVLTPPGALATVTRDRFLHEGTTFPVAAIAAYTHSVVPEQRVKADRTLPVVAFIAGAISLLVGIASATTALSLFGALLAIASIAWWASVEDRVTPALHKLTVVNASGMSRTIEGSEEAVDAVHAALDCAVAAQAVPAS